MRGSVQQLHASPTPGCRFSRARADRVVGTAVVHDWVVHDWVVHDSLGDAGEFHSTDPQPVRSATFHMVTSRTLVLGSAQRDTDVDHRVANALDVIVVKRRSGGGAVLLIPGEFVWLDLMIPADDLLWVDDVGQAMVWVGEMWQRALSDLGMATDVSRTVSDAQWSRQVCFAGLGHGEVVQHNRKAVGVSQRRTRVAARFQSMCHLRWRPELVAALVAEPRPLAAELAGQVVSIAVSATALRDALVRNLPT
jgi:lipoate---protein ligase